MAEMGPGGCVFGYWGGGRYTSCVQPVHEKRASANVMNKLIETAIQLAGCLARVQRVLRDHPCRASSPISRKLHHPQRKNRRAAPELCRG